MAHLSVPNCMLHPIPGNDLDPIGQRLRALTAAVDAISETELPRLYGDSALIAEAALQLTQIWRALEKLKAEAAE